MAESLRPLQYADNTKHISYVFEEPDNLLVVAGIDKMVNPYFAFIDVFSLSGENLALSPVIPEYSNELWKIDPSSGQIRGKTKEATGTVILSASNSNILIQSKDQRKIDFIYDKDKREYSVREISE